MQYDSNLPDPHTVQHTRGNTRGVGGGGRRIQGVGFGSTGGGDSGGGLFVLGAKEVGMVIEGIAIATVTISLALLLFAELMSEVKSWIQ